MSSSNFFILQFVQTLKISLPYNIQENYQFQASKMENTLNQFQNSSTLLNIIYNLPFLGNQGVHYLFPTSVYEKVSYDEKQAESTRILAETSFNEEYKSKTGRNIILKSKTKHIHKKLIISGINESYAQTITKVTRKASQKETRNINSNLMRIFLKNLLQLKVYSHQIDMFSTRFDIDSTEEEFYLWVQRFGINFKNYIRASQVNKIMGDEEPQHFKKIFLRLLEDFSLQIGLQHCLTSKRIERSSVKMHLQGLRNLSRDLLKMTQTKK